MLFSRGVSLLSFLALSITAAAQTTREQWAELAKSNGGVVKLNAKSFDAITKADRDWSVVIQLTALAEQYKCKPCKMFAPSFESVAQAWTKTPQKQRDGHFFATLDFADGQEIFRRLGMNSAPFVNFYPATKGEYVPQDKAKQKQWSYDFTENEFNPEAFARTLSDHTPARIKYTKPIDPTPYITAGISFVLAVAAITIFGSALKDIFISRWVWGFFSLGTIVVMISGHMFTKIRGSPYAATTRSGGVMWIASGYQNQYGAETQVVGGLYSVLALSQIALMLFVPRLNSSARQQAAVFIWTAVMVLIFSVLLGLFRQKNGGYPFKLLI